MTLRIVGSTKDEFGAQNFTISQTRPDNWIERLAKLLPAEAMALYTLGSAILDGFLTSDTSGLLIILAAACLIITCVLRYRATKDPQTGQFQWTAVLIANVSFALWFLSLNQVHMFFDMPLIPLLTLIWISITPLIYKGSPS